ncbi:MAG: hypothetical protein QOG83_3329 [Alphaproteobacteria bacterium]|nr:hypothetical protein [Alphaproteobacteria bacterium]
MHGTIESIFHVEWRPLADLTPMAADWRALAARALAPNVFYEPAFALAAAPVFGRDAGAGLVWSRSSPARLLGFFPARIERRRYGVAGSVLVGWTHSFAPLGTPLVDRDAGVAVIDAWLEHVASHPELPSLMLMPWFPADGPLAQAFDSARARRGGRQATFARHERALLAPAGRSEGYVEGALGHKKVKELRRQRRRLGDDGVVIMSIADEPAALAAALGDFLALEAGGWKGRAGTAARSNPGIRTFLETAVPHLAGEGKARIARLFLDARAIAAMIVLRSGDTAWCWKIAHDERFARSSPGVQLLLYVTEALLAEQDIARADSCAAPDHPMIDHVWRERLPLADRLVQVGAGGAVAFAFACALETMRRRAITVAKSLRDLLQR